MSLSSCDDFHNLTIFCFACLFVYCRERITAREAIKHPFLSNTLGLVRRSTTVTLGEAAGNGNNGTSNHYPGFATPPVSPSQPITPMASVDASPSPLLPVSAVPSGNPVSLTEAGLDMFQGTGSKETAVH